MISLSNVTKLYNEGRPNQMAAVDDITLTVPGDAVTVLTGPSGSGKTTLLSMIGCMARPTSGRVHLNGDMVSGLPESFLTGLRRTTFGFVFQRFNLVRGLSVIENVRLPAVPLGPDHTELTERAMARLEKLDLADKADIPVEYLSGGETQRAAIARALINDAPILIADEPTANLDTVLANRFLDIVTDLRAEGRTVIMTSHDPRIFTASLVDNVVRMVDGRLASEEVAA